MTKKGHQTLRHFCRENGNFVRKKRYLGRRKLLHFFNSQWCYFYLALDLKELLGFRATGVALVFDLIIKVLL